MSPIKLNLHKVNSNGKTIKAQSKFKITATQYFIKDTNTGVGDSVKIYDQELTLADGNIDLELKPGTNPTNNGNYEKTKVFVTITETEAPEGFAPLSKPLNIIYVKAKNALNWDSTYCPYYEIEGNTFTSTFGFDTFGYWKYDGDDRNASWPHYYLSVDNDKIKVNNVKTPAEGVGREDDIYIYNNLNKAAITKLTLFKIDETNNNKLLDGAEFTATFKNVESYSYNNTLIPLHDGQTQTFTIENGKIEISDVVFADRDQNIEISLEEIKTPSDSGKKYKVLSGKVEIKIAYTQEGLTGELKYDGDEIVQLVLNKDIKETNNMVSMDDGVAIGRDDLFKVAIIIPNIQTIDISGIVWKDEATIINNKLTGEPNGEMDENELGLPNVIVYLYKVADQNKPYQTTVTDENGRYSFADIPYEKDGYYVVFEYDGVNYTNTKLVESKAQENKDQRESFNNKFYTIESEKAINKNNSNSTIKLNYNKTKKEARYISTLITTTENRIQGYNVVAEQFAMTANTNAIINTTTDANFGLIEREMDLSLTNTLPSVKTIINGKETDSSTSNSSSNGTSVEGNNNENYEASYPLVIYKSDYNYRIRDYVNKFTDKDGKEQSLSHAEFTDNMEDKGFDSGNELVIEVTQRINVTNQSGVEINLKNVKVRLDYDERYVLKEGQTGVTNYPNDHYIEFEFNELTLASGDSKSIDVVFELVNDENHNNNKEGENTYTNYAEIISYSTEEGYIDKDSQPGNFNKQDKTTNEDDNCLASCNVTVDPNETREISGYVWEDENKNGAFDENESKVNGVCVQLIELKTFGEQRYYEYIWQETIAGSNNGKRMSLDGQDIENYTYTKSNTNKDSTGYYEFKDFIPGEYIIRFIYGDGTVVDTKMYGDVLKYNGQDYQSTLDKNYTQELYNGYNKNESVYFAARRLTSDMYAQIINNAYLRPTYKRPYYYLNNINQRITPLPTDSNDSTILGINNGSNDKGSVGTKGSN